MSESGVADAASAGAHRLVLEQDDSLLSQDRRLLFELTRKAGCADTLRYEHHPAVIAHATQSGLLGSSRRGLMFGEQRRHYQRWYGPLVKEFGVLSGVVPLCLPVKTGLWVTPRRTGDDRV